MTAILTNNYSPASKHYRVLILQPSQQKDQYLRKVDTCKRIPNMEYVHVLLLQNVTAQVQGWTPGNEPVLCWIFTRNRRDPFQKTKLILTDPECPFPGLPGAHFRAGAGASQCQSVEPQYMTTPACFSLCKRTKLVLLLDKLAQLPQFPWYI